MNSAIKIARVVFDALSEADQESLYIWMGKKLVEPPPPLHKSADDGVPKWWLAKLESGHVLPDAGWPTTLLVDDLGDDFIESLKHDMSRRGNVTAMGRFLISVGAKEEKTSSIKAPGGNSPRRRLYHLRPLDKCRAAFEAKYGPRNTQTRLTIRPVETR